MIHYIWHIFNLVYNIKTAYAVVIIKKNYMKHVLVLNIEDGKALSLVNNQGEIAWFYGDVIHDHLVFKRAATRSEFASLQRDNRYRSVYTELSIDMPTSWKVLQKNANSLRIMRFIGKKQEVADLQITTGNKVLTDIAKNIDISAIKTEPGSTIRVDYKGDFTSTVVEMLPGFKAIKMRAA